MAANRPALVFSAALSAGLLAADLVACRRPVAPPEAGLIVEEVADGAAGKAAGVRPGDRLLGWSAPGAGGGAFLCPLDLAAVETEVGPRAEVTLDAQRGGEPLRLVLLRAEWRISVRPALQGEALALYDRARKSQGDTAALAWAELARSLARSPRAHASGALAWAWARLGEEHARLGRVPESLAAFDAGIAAVAAADPREAGRAWDARGEALFARGDLGQATGSFERSLELWRKAPGAELHVAEALSDLGMTRFRQGDLQGARPLFEEAHALRHRVATGSSAEGAALINLGALAFREDRVAEAERLYRRALALHGRLLPEGRGVLIATFNLGGVAYARGDFAAAEEAWSRSLAVRRRLDPGGTAEANVLNNLGALAQRRGDFDAAADFSRQALAIRERRAPESLDVARSLHNLAVAEGDAGRKPEAAAIAGRALALRQRLAPGGLEVAETLEAIGNLALEAGDAAAAGARFTEALALRRQRAPGGLAEAESWFDVGQAASAAGDRDAAVRAHRRALGLRERLAPASFAEAESLHALGLVLAAGGQANEGRGLLERAVDAIETQVGRLGGSEDTRSRFSSRYAPFYGDLIDLLHGQGHDAQAFAVLERSRTGDLAQLLRGRDLDGPGRVPAALSSQRRQVADRYERVRAELASASTADASRVDELRGRLGELRLERERIDRAVRAAGPSGLGAEEVEPLPVAGASGLPPGTLLLAYHVGRERSLLFALTRGEGQGGGGMQVFELAVGREAMALRVEAIRQLIESPQVSAQAGLDGRLREMGDVLVGPVADRVRAGRRLLVLPDGPLHFLPFAALRLPGPRPELSPHLVELIPVHVALSLGGYLRRLEGARHAGPSDSLALFADPERRPAERTAAAELSGGALPGARREAEEIRRLFPAASFFAGSEASETRFRAEAGRHARIHVAGHARADGDYPLDSFLLLAAEGEEPEADGVLRAWELLESVRLSADLVVLSGCETGAGAERGGEGVMGLVYALQTAGARSVVASLWRVEDRSTARLMSVFYRALRDGRSADEALRDAQLALLREGDTSHPFFWAAFELFGPPN